MQKKFEISEAAYFLFLYIAVQYIYGKLSKELFPLKKQNIAICC